MTMQEMISKNHKEAYNRYIERMKELKKEQVAEQRKNKIIVSVASVLIIGLVIYYMGTVTQITNQAMNKCRNNHSEDYCIRKLG